MNQLSVEVADDAISPRIATHVLHYFDSSKGHSGGFFSDRLYELMSHADSGKLHQLSLAFPAEVAAFRLAKTTGGMQMIQTIASMLHLVSVE